MIGFFIGFILFLSCLLALPKEETTPLVGMACGVFIVIGSILVETSNTLENILEEMKKK